MIENDLWTGESLITDEVMSELQKRGLLVEPKIQKTEAPEVSDIAKKSFSKSDIPDGYYIKLFRNPQNSDEIFIIANGDLQKFENFKSLVYVSHEKENNIYKTVVSLHPTAALTLRYLLPKKTYMSKDITLMLREHIAKVPKPKAYLAPTGKHIEITTPFLRHYREMMNKLSAYPIKSGEYRVGLDRALDLEAMIAASQEGEGLHFPPIELDSDVLGLTRQRIPGFDGSVESLKRISVSVLNIVSADSQTYKQKKNSDKPLSEKFADFKIESLYDLLFYLPKRYIDKSKPQDIEDLIEGESATILGEITSSMYLADNKGVRFSVKTENGGYISVVFFRQNWLKEKFIIGSNVIITGKYSRFMGQPSLGGSSIDHSDEAALLPIVPIYKQSESKGITTKVILSAAREMISRLGDFKLPAYLQKENRGYYSDILRELHFPTSLEAHKEAVGDLAYYELIYMQIQIIDKRKNTVKHKGISQKASERKLQARAIKGFAWELTDSQKEGLRFFNKKLESKDPSTVLLNADVGAGKTILAQLAALRSVDAGYQAVLAAPTEILARQLYTSFVKLLEGMGEAGEDINLQLLVGGIPIKERNAIKKAAKDGSLDIVVGTHSVLLGSIVYKNLGLICIDEQQKFGAEQRSKILYTREDGRVPDLLMQTATPIPRSTAQVFYGDMEMLELKGKPKGRKPIVTEWIEDDPSEIVSKILHPMWADIAEETAKGYQTFVVTPLVVDSPKVDAASVERTFKALKGVFGSKVGIVHGQMKPDEQRQAMEDFRNKKYMIMVASTVVEVGVDIADASRVVVLSADRFGASSLHQIRGRTGRNDLHCKCYLVSLGKTASAQARLNAMVEFSDGFNIAKVDLETRGEGSMFGTSQSGASDMIFASLSKHSKKIPVAMDEADKILNGSYATIALEDAKNMFEAEERLV